MRGFGRSEVHPGLFILQETPVKRQAFPTFSLFELTEELGKKRGGGII